MSGRSIQWLDPALLASVLLGISLWRARRALGGLLNLPVSLEAVMIGAFCVGAWRAILVTVGVYHEVRARPVRDYTFRCAIALNACTAAVGIVEALLKRYATLWQTLGIFWVVSLALLGSARVLVWWTQRVKVDG